MKMQQRLKRTHQSRPIWKLIYTLKPYESDCSYHIENANTLYKRIVNIPCSSNLTENDVAYVVECVKGFKEKKW